MTARLPRLSSDEVVRLLKEHGFVEARQRGSHLIFYHPTRRKRAVVPMGRKNISIGTLKSILREAGLEKEVREGR